MKTKKILKSMIIAVFAFIAGYNIYLANVSNNVLTDIMLHKTKVAEWLSLVLPVVGME